jgi:hypothetical protein
MAGSITNALAAITARGGLAYSNNFDVQFKFGASGNSVNSALSSVGIRMGSQTGTSMSEQGKWINFFCEEATLPGVQAATGTINGRHMGEGQVLYPHTRIYNDFSLTWVCDANMTPVKFLHVWMDEIFRDYKQSGVRFNRSGSYNWRYQGGGSDRVNTGFGGGGNVRYNYIRLGYPQDYLCDEVVITKCEKGPSAEQQRSAIAYHMVDVFPYSIDAAPMSYGSSQIVKVSANFYYAKWYSVFNTLGTSSATLPVIP